MLECDIYICICTTVRLSVCSSTCHDLWREVLGSAACGVCVADRELRQTEVSDLAIPLGGSANGTSKAQHVYSYMSDASLFTCVYMYARVETHVHICCCVCTSALHMHQVRALTYTYVFCEHMCF